jgi:starvation-inducible outer membrane lipoprotein
MKTIILLAVAPLSLLALGGCSGSLPNLLSCTERFAAVDIPADWTVHSRLVFDYSEADPETKLRILREGIGSSARPTIVIGSSAGANVTRVNANGQPRINVNRREVTVAGPSGPRDEVIQSACALEREGIQLTSVTLQPYDADAIQAEEVAN